MEALHANDSEEVVDEQQDDDGRGQPGDEDDGRAEDVPKTFFHPEEGQQSEKTKFIELQKVVSLFYKFWPRISSCVPQKGAQLKGIGRALGLRKSGVDF